MLAKISAYLQSHEKLILGVGTLVIVLYLGNRWINSSEVKADEANQRAQAALVEQKKIVDNLTSSLQDAQKRSDAVVTQSAMQVFNLQQEIASLRNSLALEQEAIRTKPISAIASDWNQLIQIPDGVTNTSIGITVSEAAARATLSTLVEVPVLQKTVDNQSKELASKDLALSAQAATIKASDDLVSGLRVQIVDGQTACTKQVALEKANARKGKRTWFLIGFASGLATRVLAHF